MKLIPEEDLTSEEAELVRKIRRLRGSFRKSIPRLIDTTLETQLEEAAARPDLRLVVSNP